MELTKFDEKLNKVDGNVYTIEEIVHPVDGVYAATLAHDNVELSTLNIYTGSKLTGNKINTYTISTPSLTPWKTNIKIFSTEENLYISYETTGDTVEAEDVNKLQDSVNDTQEALNDEITRATNRENVIENNLNEEITRAKNVEKVITDNLNSEITRATKSENTLTTNLNAEIERTKKAESILQSNIDAEKARATNAENTLQSNIDAEKARATNAENTLQSNIDSEVTRAKKAESDINNIINSNKPVWDDKYTKAEVDNKISKVITDLDWKESVATYSDLSKTYPNPQDGWTVNVKDTDITYRYSGTAWISISANSIPLATSSTDGKMSKTDKSFLDTVRNLWASITSHISDTVKHITSAERSLWNTVSNKLDKSGGTISNPNYRGQLKIHRSEGGNSFAEILYSNNDKDLGSMGFDNNENAIVTDGGNTVHYKIYHEGNKPKLSELKNDAGYITSKDSVATSSHTHSNKYTLDKITEDSLARWDNISVKTLSFNNNPYMKILTLNFTRIYMNTPITFDLIGRSTVNKKTSYSIKFTNEKNTSPSVSDFLYTGDKLYGANSKIYKMTSDGSKFELWIKNGESYDEVRVCNLVYPTGIDVKFDGEISTALPTTFATSNDCTLATVAENVSGNAYTATKATQDSDGEQINTTYVKKGMTWNELEGV